MLHFSPLVSLSSHCSCAREERTLGNTPNTPDIRTDPIYATWPQWSFYLLLMKVKCTSGFGTQKHNFARSYWGNERRARRRRVPSDATRLQLHSIKTRQRPMSWSKLQRRTMQNNHWVHLNGKLYQTQNHHTITNLLAGCHPGENERRNHFSFLLTNTQIDWERAQSSPLFSASVPWKMPNESRSTRGEKA